VTEEGRPDRRPIGRGLVAGVAIAGLAVLVLVVGTLTLGSRSGAHSTPAAPAGTPGGSAVSDGSVPPSAVPATPSPTVPAPTPTAVALVPAPLTGVLVTPQAALQHPIAVMIDDHQVARPQSGFNSAAIIFQAPAEGGIPRYMLVFQDHVPTAVGPIRSSRQYYIEWAAEWRAMYVHFGGSPQALETLRVDGHGQLVWNADGFRWSPAYMWRNHARPAPHNVYTDGKHLRDLARRIDAVDGPVDPAFTFAPIQASARPVGNTISLFYPYETVVMKYDPVRNAYFRYIDGSKKPQVDAADKLPVTPTNVVILRMHFGALANSNPEKHRLEAADVGRGDAWISTGGTTIHGSWRKKSVTAPIELFDAKGQPVTLQPGQTAIEVIPLTYGYRIVQGKVPPPPPSRTVDGANAPA